jgi:DNA helicase II / ATP-dependent DNA helicase PcrA
VVRDLSGVGGPSDPSPAMAGGRRPPFGYDQRPRSAPREFRLTTAAALAGSLGGIVPGGARAQINLDAFQIGVLVVHPDYGLGRITATEGEGTGRKGKVAFAVGPARTFVFAKSPLKPMSKPT